MAGRRISYALVIRRPFRYRHFLFISGGTSIPGLLPVICVFSGGVPLPTSLAVTAVTVPEKVHGRHPADEQQDEPVVNNPLHHLLLPPRDRICAGGVNCLEQCRDDLVAGLPHRAETDPDPLHHLSLGLQLGIVVG